MSDLDADRVTGQAFVTVDSFDSPTALWRIVPDEPATRWSTPVDDGTVPALSVSHVSYPSLDGTSIGLFLIHRDDVTPGPDVPAILNGYGGFAISETPVWSPQIAAWCAASICSEISRGATAHNADTLLTGVNVKSNPATALVFCRPDFATHPDSSRSSAGARPYSAA